MFTVEIEELKKNLAAHVRIQQECSQMAGLLREIKNGLVVSAFINPVEAEIRLQNQKFSLDFHTQKILELQTQLASFTKAIERMEAAA